MEVICEVEGCPPPALISWTIGGQSVTEAYLNLTNGRNNFINDDDSRSTPKPIVSRLALSRPNANARHSGNYTCTSKCTPPINVSVHVLRGKLTNIIYKFSISILFTKDYTNLNFTLYTLNT